MLLAHIIQQTAQNLAKEYPEKAAQPGQLCLPGDWQVCISSSPIVPVSDFSCEADLFMREADQTSPEITPLITQDSK